MIQIKIIGVIAFVITTTIVLSFLLFRSKRKEIVLTVVTLILSALLVEVFLKFFYPQVHEHDRMFEVDQLLGWKFVANKKGMIIHPGEARHFIRTNSSGFRDDPLPLDKEEIKKILVLGDSFVTNISVKADDVFTEVMERQLKNTSVINFGVNGYGQIQEYLLLKKWLDIVNPDLVILVIYIRNDFADNIGRNNWLHPRPIASWDEEDLSLKSPPPKSFSTNPTPFY